MAVTTLAREAPAVPSSQKLIVTIDGPAASGKSSVARFVARLLRIPYVSSGLLYRAATYLALEEGVSPEDEAAILELLGARRVRLEAVVNENDHVWLGSADISGELSTDAVDAYVSAVARHAGVRSWVQQRLREIVAPFVIEGRDMGRVVFPESPYKFYLQAPAEVRARRRVGERSGSLAEVAAALERRDELDVRQLAPAPDATFINTANLSVEQVAAEVLGRIHSTIGSK